MGTDVWGYNDSGSFTATSSSSASITISNGWDTAYLTNYDHPPEPETPGPLAWLNERVDEIADMGRELMEQK